MRLQILHDGSRRKREDLRDASLRDKTGQVYGVRPARGGKVREVDDASREVARLLGHHSRLAERSLSSLGIRSVSPPGGGARRALGPSKQLRMRTSSEKPIFQKNFFLTESYAHRDEVVKAKRSDKKAVEEYLKFALTCLVSQVYII